MPRKLTIDSKKRIRVFLTYRLNKAKVYPTAKKFDLVRSTTSNIVKEFVFNRYRS